MRKIKKTHYGMQIMTDLVRVFGLSVGSHEKARFGAGFAFVASQLDQAAFCLPGAL